MKKRILLISLFVVSNLAMASWWGDLSKTERASVIATGIIATQNRYNNYEQPKKEKRNLVPEEKVEEYIPKPNPNKPVPITNQSNEKKIIETENKYMQQENKNSQKNNDSIDLTENDIIEIRKKIEAGAGNIIEMDDGRVIQIDDEGYPHIVK